MNNWHDPQSKYSIITSGGSKKHLLHTDLFIFWDVKQTVKEVVFCFQVSLFAINKSAKWWLHWNSALTLYIKSGVFWFGNSNNIDSMLFNPNISYNRHRNKIEATQKFNPWVQQQLREALMTNWPQNVIFVCIFASRVAQCAGSGIGNPRFFTNFFLC